MTMKRAIFILLALCGSTLAQTTNITVVADSSRVIRTNFSITRSQVADLSDASFAISNIAGLQSAIDAKLSANGSAASLTNFPSLLLTTNSAASAFPSALVRTNGDASGLTNLPNANLSTATGVLSLSNGGSGATNALTALTNLTILSGVNNVLIGNTISSSSSNSVVIGFGSLVNQSAAVDAIAIGRGAVASGAYGITVGSSSGGGASNSIQIGYVANAGGARAIAIGRTTSASGSSAIAIGNGAGASGSNAVALNGTASGSQSVSIGSGSQAAGQASIAIGSNSLVGTLTTNSIQIGGGSNYTTETIQFLSAGSVTTNSWSALASSSTQGRYAMTNTAGISGSKTFVAYDGAAYTTNTVTFSNGIITGWTQ